MQVFKLQIGLGERRGIKQLEHSESINAENIVDAIIKAKEIVAQGAWRPSSNVARLFHELNGERLLLWFRPTAVLKGASGNTAQEKSPHRYKPNANDNTEGLHLLSMPERARAMAFISSSSEVAELWELHALICERDAVGPKAPRTRRPRPVLALV